MINILDNKNNSLPQKVDQNEENIKKLAEYIKPEYHTDEALTTESTGLDIALTDIGDCPDADPTGGNLLASNGLLFEIVSVFDAKVFIKYIADLKGPKGDKGDKGEKGDTGEQGPIGPTGGTDKKDTATYTIPNSVTGARNIQDICQYFYNRRNENTSNYLLTDLHSAHTGVINALGKPDGVNSIDSTMKIIFEVISNKDRPLVLDLTFESLNNNIVYKGTLKCFDNPATYPQYCQWTGWAKQEQVKGNFSLKLYENLDETKIIEKSGLDINTFGNNYKYSLEVDLPLTEEIFNNLFNKKIINLHSEFKRYGRVESSRNYCILNTYTTLNYLNILFYCDTNELRQITDCKTLGHIEITKTNLKFRQYFTINPIVGWMPKKLEITYI